MISYAINKFAFQGDSVDTPPISEHLQSIATTQYEGWLEPLLMTPIDVVDTLFRSPYEEFMIQRCCGKLCFIQPVTAEVAMRLFRDATRQHMSWDQAFVNITALVT